MVALIMLFVPFVAHFRVRARRRRRTSNSQLYFTNFLAPIHSQLRRSCKTRASLPPPPPRQVHTHLTPSSIASCRILSISAVGCPDVTSNATHVTSRDGDKLRVTCNATDQTWYLPCDGREWVGTIEPCHNTGQPNKSY